MKFIKVGNKYCRNAYAVYNLFIKKRLEYNFLISRKMHFSIVHLNSNDFVVHITRDCYIFNVSCDSSEELPKV